MASASITVWTNRRKWLGNLLPAIFWFPFLVAGLIVIVRTGDPLGKGLWLLIAGTVLGWLAVNQLGLFENARMERQLERILDAQGKKPNGEKIFVGFATPKYTSALDAHEDVGFLVIDPDNLRFLSETREVDIPRSSIKEVRTRPNVHTLLLLGRWVSVEGEMDGRPIRLLVEPRQHRTLLRNRGESRMLVKRLQVWAPSPKPAPGELADEAS